MRMKVVVCLLALFSFGALSVRTQESSKINVFLGYSYVQARASTTGLDSFHLNGGSASTDYNFAGWLAGVADFCGYTNGNIGRSGAGATLLTRFPETTSGNQMQNNLRVSTGAVLRF